jgi:phage terminase large subunit-like protein
MSESTFAGETSGGMEPPKIIKPQQGPQTIFLASRADIAIYGGAAGGGKSHALLMQPLRHIRNGGFGAVIFRRTNPQIMAEGGLWDQSHELYRYVGGRPLYGQSKQWIFKSGAKITFSHMDHEDDKHNWDSSQIPLIEFDEVTSFTESQFVYMFSRNRSTCGVKPYIRAACNPDSDSWLAKWIEWWIDQDTGYPILERSGVVRWFVRDGDGMVWFGSKAEAVEWLVDKKSMARALAEKVPKSFTFVPANLDDNKILDQVNPEYRANLMAMPDVERERLLRGNWKIRPAAGLKFPRDKWELVDAPPNSGDLRLVRFWDRAYTEGGKGARTAGVLMAEMVNEEQRKKLSLPRYWIIHVVADRWGDAKRESEMRHWAEMDRAKYGHVTVGIEREGGAGKHSANVSVNNLSGFDVYTEHPTAKKHLRWSPLAAQQQIRNVAIVKGDWDWSGMVRELDSLAGDETLDKTKLKDIADAAAGAFKFLTSGSSSIVGDLIASGENAEEEERPMTQQDIDGLPDFFRELVEESNNLGAQGGGWQD